MCPYLGSLQTCQRRGFRFARFNSALAWSLSAFLDESVLGHVVPRLKRETSIKEKLEKVGELDFNTQRTKACTEQNDVFTFAELLRSPLPKKEGLKQ
jgi:hypothetical protein